MCLFSSYPLCLVHSELTFTLGFIHESLRLLMIRKYGDYFWQRALDKAGIKSGTENKRNQYYDDSVTFKLVGVLAELAEVSTADIWEMYGHFLIEYTMEIGWESLLKAISPDLKGFLDSLDSIHYFIDCVLHSGNVRGPSFLCQTCSPKLFKLHYHSRRSGLHPIVKGAIEEIANVIYGQDISLSISNHLKRVIGDKNDEHVVFNVESSYGKKLISRTVSEDSSSSQEISIPSQMVGAQLRLKSLDFTVSFPYHLIFDENCLIEHYGFKLGFHMPYSQLKPGTPLKDIFTIFWPPEKQIDFDQIQQSINGVFILQSKQLATNERRASTCSNLVTFESNVKPFPKLKLKGQMILLFDKKHILFLCSPHLTTVEEMMACDMRLEDFALYDVTRDIILMNINRITDMELDSEYDQVEEHLQAITGEIEQEKEKFGSLLAELIPKGVARTYAARSEVCTILFADFPTFSSNIPVSLLNDIFITFDRLVQLLKVTRVKAIGDCYMACAGIPKEQHNHCEFICYLALGMIYETKDIFENCATEFHKIRIGIDTGPAVACVIGQKAPKFCIFGQTVDSAKKMLISGKVGKIHCSSNTAKAAQLTGRFAFEQRNQIRDSETSWLTASYKKSIWEITDKQRDIKINSLAGYKELNLKDATIENSNIVLSDNSNKSQTCVIT